MATNFQRLEERVLALKPGRKAASALIELAEEAAAALPHDLSRDAFWERLKERARKEVPDAPVKAGGRVLAEPMTDAEARRFEKTKVPYGKPAERGQTVGECDLSWLVWLSGQQDRFKVDVGRYLASATLVGLIESRADDEGEEAEE